MAFVYNKSSSSDEYTKFINEMKQGSKKKAQKHCTRTSIFLRTNIVF